jgi:predicted amidohydrolase
MWSNGYFDAYGIEEADGFHWSSRAVPSDGEFVSYFRELARTLDLAILITYLEARGEGPPRNSATLIDRRGEALFTYAKVHLCAFDEPESLLAPGDAFPVAALDTKSGSVQVGAMICYDREFPESARLLMLQGAEIILTPNACKLRNELNGVRIDQFRARAFENMVGVAMANYPALSLREERFDGHSCAFGPDGGLIVEAGEGEEIAMAEFDLDRLRAWRKAETWGNAFRRPGAYGAIVSRKVREPFVRTRPSGEPFQR